MSRLILLPALGADERIFSRLGRLPVEVVTPRLPDPRESDTMATYARRIAEGLDIGKDDLIGGVSFGGMVAAEIARQRKVKALALISSGATSECIAPAARKLSRFGLRLPAMLLRPFLESDRAFRQVFGPDAPSLYSLARQMLKDAPDVLILRGGRLCLGYLTEAKIECPVRAIHGGEDRAMKAPAQNCRIVPGAGHGLVVTHAAEVTVFLRELLLEFQDEEG